MLVFFLTRDYDCEIDNEVLQMLKSTSELLILYADYVQENNISWRYNMCGILKAVLEKYYLKTEGGLK